MFAPKNMLLGKTPMANERQHFRVSVAEEPCRGVHDMQGTHVRLMHDGSK